MSLELFAYGSAVVRTTVLDGDPWFVAADVCSVLGLSNVTEALRRLDDDERTLISADAPNGLPINAVNEPGLYSLIFRSRKAEARAFKRWVTHEVLPAIRRTGSYGAPSAEHGATVLALSREVVAQSERAADAEHRALVAEYRLSEIAQVLGMQSEARPQQHPSRIDPRREAVRRWVAAHTVPIEPGTQARELYTAFAQSPDGAGISETLFGRVLTEMGFEVTKRTPYRFRPLHVVGGTDLEGLSS